MGRFALKQLSRRRRNRHCGDSITGLATYLGRCPDKGRAEIGDHGDRTTPRPTPAVPPVEINTLEIRSPRCYFFTGSLVPAASDLPTHLRKEFDDEFAVPDSLFSKRSSRPPHRGITIWRNALHVGTAHRGLPAGPGRRATHPAHLFTGGCALATGGGKQQPWLRPLNPAACSATLQCKLAGQPCTARGQCVQRPARPAPGPGLSTPRRARIRRSRRHCSGFQPSRRASTPTGATAKWCPASLAWTQRPHR